STAALNASTGGFAIRSTWNAVTLVSPCKAIGRSTVLPAGPTADKACNCTAALLDPMPQRTSDAARIDLNVVRTGSACPDTDGHLDVKWKGDIDIGLGGISCLIINLSLVFHRHAIIGRELHGDRNDVIKILRLNLYHAIRIRTKGQLNQHRTR